MTVPSVGTEMLSPSTVTASRNCTQNDRPQCISPWIRNFEEQLKLGVPPAKIISLVAERLTNVSENILGGDVNRSIGLLGRLTDVQERRFNNEAQKITKEEAIGFAETMITCGNALLKKHIDRAWRTIQEDRWSEVASGIIDSSERAGILLARTMPNKTHWITEDHIVMEIRNGSTRLDTFPDLDKSGDSLLWAEVKDRITLPRTEHHVVSAIFNNVGQYLKPKSANRTIISRIISATLVNGSSSAGLNMDGYVTIVLEHFDETFNGLTFCVFWDVSHGNWSHSGCNTVTTNATHTTCKCNHLTSFAILVDTTGQHGTIGPEHELALRVITNVGCIISIVCLCVCICAFLGFRRVRCIRTIIHAHLCTCLLSAEVVFLVAIEKTENKLVCDIIAIILHYLFLAVFTWMCVEGVELYVLLVKVFNLKMNRLIYYHLVGYGAPAVVVAISVTIDYFVKFKDTDEVEDEDEDGYFDGYGTNTYCWLSVDSYFIWSFVGPMLLVVLVNIGFLAMTLKVICTQKAHDTSNQSEQGIDIKFWIRVSLALVCILGLTWVFGVLYISQETLVFAYVFTIINSFQGLFIFIFHFLLNETVQDEIERRFGDKYTCCRSKKKRQKTVKRQTRRTARSPQQQEIWLGDFTDTKDSQGSATDTKDTLFNIDDEGFVENTIYEGGAGAEGSVDNVIYEGQPD
ncbi:adhesion G protein-coupled receptor L3-like [Branchiostoma lanceolatum]|uniref:adhesion G protein-coupled receptor L3-like n=1 Tax=Branchiostoma lanceolatum TaxID=7740 RepID=UPI003456DE41